MVKKEIRTSYFMKELSSIQAELKSKDDSIRKLALVLKFSKQKLEKAEAKIKELETKLAQRELESQNIVSTSNPMRSVSNPNGKYTKFTIRYLDKTFQINNISLNDPGSVLRQKIEEMTSCKVGAIFRADHTLLHDNKLLKKHQYCFKPTVITALPVDFPVTEGSRLEIKILSVGETV